MRSGVNLLNSVFPNIRFTVDDLNEWVQQGPEQDFDYAEDDHDENDDNIETEELKIKHEDVIKSFDVCIKWAKQNNIESTKQIVLVELQEEAVKMNLNIPKKQSTINQFFK
ncbi:PREDICTED: uncharacterized protein LOC108369273 [Rhagoletis zephyria]|uniref:uncharacterized protein LOC108369273 n=1 Tax=Rhagoletis zephyria TaxID=28612 RepID=UPI00081169D7|nr:PREDICTED: uncharacterized protein LOC108369273 [Rhagoletis zephyria]